MLKQGLRLKESEMNERNAGAGPYRVKGTCSRIHPTLLAFGEGRAPWRRTVETHYPSSLGRYGKYNLPSNLLCFTKKCLFEIPWSVIKGAIELQNTIIIARLGVALAH